MNRRTELPAAPDADPRVTIGIPTCNRASLLVQALESALAQTHRNVEIVVSDNASTDETPRILAAYGDRITVITQREHIGIADNWNACLDAASGAFFLMLSDDDYLEPHAVEDLLAAHDDSTAFVYGRTAVHNPAGTLDHYPITPPSRERCPAFIAECFANRRYSPTGATLFRTSDMRASGGYRWQGFQLVLDAAMMMKVALAHPDSDVRFVDQVVFHYRVHAANMTNAARITSWVQEIEGLFRIVLLKLDASPAQRKRLRRLNDAYVVAFVFHLATQAPVKTFGERLALIGACYRVCMPYRGMHTMRSFAYGCAKLIMPERLVRTIRMIAHRRSG